jgi:tyrosinase
MTSPNDPIFFLHHCFVDKVWADWQWVQAESNPAANPHYAPEMNGPPGHNLNDTLKPWHRKVADVLDIQVLGYSYEPSPAQEMMLEVARATAEAWRRSPFWAD